MGNRTLRIMCIYINIASNTRKKILEFFREIVSENCSAQEHNNLANFRTRISRLGDQRLIRLATASPFTSTKVKNS